MSHPGNFKIGDYSPMACLAIRSHQQVSEILGLHRVSVLHMEQAAVQKLARAIGPDRESFESAFSAADDSAGLLPGVPEIERLSAALSGRASVYSTELARMNSEIYRLCGAIIEEAVESAESAPEPQSERIERSAIRSVAKIRRDSAAEMERFERVLDAAEPHLPSYLRPREPLISDDEYHVANMTATDTGRVIKVRKRSYRMKSR